MLNWIECSMFNVQCLWNHFFELVGARKLCRHTKNTRTTVMTSTLIDFSTFPHDRVLIRRALCVVLVLRLIIVGCAAGCPRSFSSSSALAIVLVCPRPRLPSSSSALVLVCSHLPVRPRLLLACCCPPSCVALGDCRLLCFRLLCYGLLCCGLLCFRLLCSWPSCSWPSCSWPSCSARGLLVVVACQWLRAAVNLLYFY